MIQSRTKRIVGLISGCLVVVVLAIGGLAMKAGGQIIHGRKIAIPAEQAIAAIRTAIAAKPGNVQTVEVDNENGKITCEIGILAHDSKTYEVEVDVTTNKVIEVEESDDNHDDENNEPNENNKD